MTICSLRRHYRLTSLVVLSALMLQAAAVTASAACAAMSPLPEITDHAGVTGESHEALAGHFDSVSEARVDNDYPCDCGPGEPAESGEQEAGSCAMGGQCMSSPAVVAGASVLAEPAIEIRALDTVCARPHPVALSRPTPPPKV